MQCSPHLSIYGKPNIGDACSFHASLLSLCCCQISAPSHQSVRGSRELPQELGQVCMEGRALCLLVTNRNNRRNVLPEPAAQMAGGDRLPACACPPANMGSALPGPLQEGTLPKKLFCPEVHLGNGLKCTSQMLSPAIAVQELLNFPDPPELLCCPALSFWITQRNAALLPPSPTSERERGLGVRRHGFSSQLFALLT